MSNYTIALDDFPGPDTPSHGMINHRASENVAGGVQFSHPSNSLSSALTPVVSKVEGKKAHMWPQTSSDKNGSQIHFPGSPLNNRSWCAEHCGQTIYESASVMPERHLFVWSSVNSLQGAYDGNHSLLGNDAGRRHALTLAPQDMYQQLPQQQRQTSVSRLKNSLYARPGIPSHTSLSASKTSVSPTNHQPGFSYHAEQRSGLCFQETTSVDVQPSTASTYFASSGSSHAERLMPGAEKPCLSPEFLYVNADNLEDEPTIRCPHKWCKSTFTRSNDLARHLSTASMHRERVHVDPSKCCRLCGEEFSRSDARNRHEIKRSCGKKRTRRIAQS